MSRPEVDDADAQAVPAVEGGGGEQESAAGDEAFEDVAVEGVELFFAEFGVVGFGFGSVTEAGDAEVGCVVEFPVLGLWRRVR